MVRRPGSLRPNFWDEHGVLTEKKVPSYWQNPLKGWISAS